jgi:hypothetical protein
MLRQIRNGELAVGLWPSALMIAVAFDTVDSRSAGWFVTLLALPDVRHKHVFCLRTHEGVLVTGQAAKRPMHVVTEAAVAKPTVGNLWQRVLWKTIRSAPYRIIMTVPAATALFEQQILSGGELLIDPCPLALR